MANIISDETIEYVGILAKLELSAEEKEQAKKDIEADMVLLAMGFLKPEQPKFAENVFLAGDADTGASLVVRAMAGGRKAASDIDTYLME